MHFACPNLLRWRIRRRLELLAASDQVAGAVVGGELSVRGDQRDGEEQQNGGPCPGVEPKGHIYEEGN